MKPRDAMRKWLPLISALVGIIIFITGYNSLPQFLDNFWGTNNPSARGRAQVRRSDSAPRCSLTAYPVVLENPSDVKLTWDSINSSSGSIDHGVGALFGARGSVTANDVSETTTFTATFTDAERRETAQCSALVVAAKTRMFRAQTESQGADGQPSCRLDVFPSTLIRNGNIILTWDSSNATSGWMDHGVNSLKGEAGNVQFSDVWKTSTYTASFTNSKSGKTAICTATVTVVRE